MKVGNVQEGILRETPDLPWLTELIIRLIGSVKWLVQLIKVWLKCVCACHYNSGFWDETWSTYKELAVGQFSQSSCLECVCIPLITQELCPVYHAKVVYFSNLNVIACHNTLYSFTIYEFIKTNLFWKHLFFSFFSNFMHSVNVSDWLTLLLSSDRG